MKKTIITITLILTACYASAQNPDPMFANDFTAGQWSADLFSGYFSNGNWATLPTGATYDQALNTIPPSSRERSISASVNSDNGWILGARCGQDWEFIGWEASLAGVFADLDVTTNLPAGEVASDTLYTSGDASLLLTGANLLYYPGGNYLMDGHLRPYFTAGPGLAFFLTDQKYLDDELLVDFNAGLGAKFFPGKTTAPFIRVDWRWHHLFAGSDIQDTFRQELTVGLGLQF